MLDVGASVSATLLEIENGVFEILARVRDRKTGGWSLDERIAGYAEAVYIRTSGKGREGRLREEQMPVLRRRAEEAKITLSTQDSVVIDVPTNDGAVFSVGLARNEFVAMSMDLFADVMQCVEQVLLEANVTASDVTQVGDFLSPSRSAGSFSSRLSSRAALHISRDFQSSFLFASPDGRPWNPPT